MGLFGRKRPEGPTADADRADAVHAVVPLTDPGLPETDLTQVVHTLFTHCGLMWVAYGPGTVSELFTECARVAPVLIRSEPQHSGFGLLRGSGQMPWIALRGEQGSAVAVFALPEADVRFLMIEVADPIKNLAAPWQWVMGTRSNRWDSRAAAIIDSARAVPVWELPGLVHTRPSSTRSAPMPEAFTARLRAQGWARGNGDFFTASTETHNGRHRPVHLTTSDAQNFAVMSVVCDAPGDTLPVPLRGCELGGFELLVIDGFVLLLGRLPAGPPSPSRRDVEQCASAVANYAERLAEDLGVDLEPGEPPIDPAAPGRTDRAEALPPVPVHARVQRLATGSTLVSWDEMAPGSMYKVSRRAGDGTWRVVGRTGGLSLEDGGADPTGPLPAYAVEPYG